MRFYISKCSEKYGLSIGIKIYHFYTPSAQVIFLLRTLFLIFAVFFGFLKIFWFVEAFCFPEYVLRVPMILEVGRIEWCDFQRVRFISLFRNMCSCHLTLGATCLEDVGNRNRLKLKPFDPPYFSEHFESQYVYWK